MVGMEGWGRIPHYAQVGGEQPTTNGDADGSPSVVKMQNSEIYSKRLKTFSSIMELEVGTLPIKLDNLFNGKEQGSSDLQEEKIENLLKRKGTQTR
jgi:hypothetical protein